MATKKSSSFTESVAPSLLVNLATLASEVDAAFEQLNVARTTLLVLNPEVRKVDLDRIEQRLFAAREKISLASNQINELLHEAIKVTLGEKS